MRTNYIACGHPDGARKIRRSREDTCGCSCVDTSGEASEDRHEESSSRHDWCGLLHAVEDGVEDSPATSKEPTQDFLRDLFWLSAWARPRLVMELAWRFAEKGEYLPLRMTAGQAIPLVMALTFSRWAFNLAVMVLAAQTSACSQHDVAQYNYVVWLVWLPVQLMYVVLEAYAFTFIAVPKVQALRKGHILHFRPRFAFWFAWQMTLSTLSSMDSTCDSLFFGTQINQRNCEVGAIMEERWLSIYRPTFGALVVPYYSQCWIGWLFTFVPLLYLLVAVSHTCCDSEQYPDFEIAFDAMPQTDYMGTDIRQDDRTKLISRKQSRWQLEYRTVLKERANHGEAVMGFAEINGLHSIVYEDLQFAQFKANRCFDIVEKELTHCICGTSLEDKPIEDRKSIARKELVTAKNHVASQLRRGVAYTLLVGALVNGYQLLLQTNALAMSLNTSNASWGTAQALWSLTLSLVNLCTRFKGALETIKVCSDMGRRLKKLAPLVERETSESDLCCWLSLLIVGAFICFLVIVWAILKIVAIRFCPHSVWTPFAGCWIPDTEYSRFCATLADMGNLTMPC